MVGESGYSRGLIDNPFVEGFRPLHYTPNHQIVNDIPLIKSRRNVDAVTMPVNNTESGEVILRLAFSD